MGQERLLVHDDVDIVDAQAVIEINVLSVDGQELRAGVQHVQQRHFAVGLHPVHMDDVAVALKLDDVVVLGSLSRHAAQA